METLELDCEQRPLGTKGQVRSVRRAGRVPAVVYGPKTQPMTIAVWGAALKGGTLSSGSQRLLKFKSADPELAGRHVIVKEMQRGAIDGDLLHADFYEVDLSAKIRVSVPLRFIGRARGVGDGGILQPLERAIEVECLPLEIPEGIDVDVTPIGIHEAVHISTLQFGPNVEPVFDTDYPLVTVLPPTVEAPAPGAAAPAEGAAEAATAESAGGGEKAG
jgi:large subunit ribosomal protein L25